MDIADLVSKEERKKRLGSNLVNGILWIVLIIVACSTAGFALIFYGLAWLISYLTAEYNVRSLQALGTMASEEQFTEIQVALREICEELGCKTVPRVIIVNVSQSNAMAVKFARKRVIVLFSQTVEGMLEDPAEMRFVLGHEVAHLLLDHGARGVFELYKPAAYKAARELTCDNTGLAVSGDIEASKTALKRLGVGNTLHPMLDDSFLEHEAKYLYSGITGWLLKQYLSHPPLGRRIANINEFAAENME